MIQGCQVPPVVNDGIAHAESRRPDVACAVHPVRIGGRGRGRPNVDVNVGAVSMLNHTAIKNVRALVHSDICLRMDTKMQTIEVIDAVAQTFRHGGKESAQGLGFVTAFDSCDSRAFDVQSNRITEIGRYAYIP